MNDAALANKSFDDAADQISQAAMLQLIKGTPWQTIIRDAGVSFTAWHQAQVGKQKRT